MPDPETTPMVRRWRHKKRGTMYTEIGLGDSLPMAKFASAEAAREFFGALTVALTEVRPHGQ